MNVSTVLDTLHNLTQARITKADLARALGVDPSALRRKEIAGIILKPNEIAKIETYFRVNLHKPQYYSGERQNDTAVDEKSSQFGLRLSELQAQHNFLDREMAQLLKISEKDYGRLIVNKIQPDLDILNRIKQNFKVSIDYLLYGE